MPQYEVIKEERGETIKRTDEDGTVWSIPTVAGNSDYQAYLAWLENPQGQQSTPSVNNAEQL